ERVSREPRTEMPQITRSATTGKAPVRGAPNVHLRQSAGLELLTVALVQVQTGQECPIDAVQVGVVSPWGVRVRRGENFGYPKFAVEAVQPGDRAAAGGYGPAPALPASARRGRG